MSYSHYIPDLSVLVKFSVAIIALFLVPGPDMILCLSKTISFGKKTAYSVFAGITAGLLVHCFLAAFSISALLLASETAFLILRVLGALYLVWLACNVLIYGSEINVKTQENGRADIPSFTKSFMTGLGVNLTNPKIILFFITFLPQFVASHDPYAQGKLMFLGFYFVLLSTPLMCMLILVADTFVATLKRHPRILRGIDYVFSGIFVSLAVGIFFSNRQGG